MKGAEAKRLNAAWREYYHACSERGSIWASTQAAIPSLSDLLGDLSEWLAETGAPLACGEDIVKAKSLVGCIIVVQCAFKPMAHAQRAEALRAGKANLDLLQIDLTPKMQQLLNATTYVRRFSERGAFVSAAIL